MKTTKIIYWTSTAIIALMMTFSAYAYFTQPGIDEGFAKMGFRSFFRIELGVAKFIGALLIIVPVAARLKEWVYAGFTIVFISAFITHVSLGDPIANIVSPLIFLAILAVSYISYHKLHAFVNLNVAKA